MNDDLNINIDDIDYKQSSFVAVETFVNNLFNYPIRNENVHSIIPWEQTAFENLCNQKNIIEVEQLIDAYYGVMGVYNLKCPSNHFLKTSLANIRHDNMYLVSAISDNDKIKDVIKKVSFYKTLKYYESDLRWRMRHRFIKGNNNKRYCQWTKCTIIFHMISINIIIAMISIVVMILKHINLKSWMLSIYILSSMTALNVLLYLLSTVDLSMDKLKIKILNAVPRSYIPIYKKSFACISFICYILYSIGYLLQINETLNKCKNGCNIRDVFFVKKYIQYDNATPLNISWKFFMEKPVVWISYIIILCSSILYFVDTDSKLFIFIKYISVICFIIQQSLDSCNISLQYLLIALLIISIYQRRYDLYNHSFWISNHNVCHDIVKIPIKPRKYMMNYLDDFNYTYISFHHDSFSKYKWDKCILYKDTYDDLSYIFINKKRLYADISLDINRKISFGSCHSSIIRNYHLYEIVCLFCKDIGILQFIALINDRDRNIIKNRVNLIWEISDIEYIIKYNDILSKIKRNGVNININIHYAPLMNTHNTFDHKILAKFNYLQCIIFKHCNVDILTSISSDVYCQISKIDVYNSVRDWLITASSIGLYDSSIGIFICGDESFVNHIEMNAKILKTNDYGIKINMLVECI